MPTTTNVKLSLGYVILYVKDTAKSVPFYRDILGLTVKVDHPGWAELETGAATVALHSDDKLPAKRDEHTNVCFNVDDIFGTYETLKSKGVKFDCEPQMVCEAEGKEGKSASFQDPDGNKLSIFGYVKK